LLRLIVKSEFNLCQYPPGQPPQIYPSFSMREFFSCSQRLSFSSPCFIELSAGPDDTPLCPPSSPFSIFFDDDLLFPNCCYGTDRWIFLAIRGSPFFFFFLVHPCREEISFLSFFFSRSPFFPSQSPQERGFRVFFSLATSLFPFRI